MKIVGIASAIPQPAEPAASNAALEARLGLERGWIEKRTGILQRPAASPLEATSDLAIRAAAAAIEQAEAAGIEREGIGLLLLATSTPDHLLPPTAPLAAHRLGLRNAGAVDLAGACAGFVYALVLAGAYTESSRRPALVIGANVLTRRLDPADAATAALFADGAGAAVIAPCSPDRLLGSYLGSDGSLYDCIGIAAGGSREPLTPAAVEEGRHLMTMRKGPALFRQAVQAMAFAGRAALEAASMTSSAIDWWVPHQANARMIRDVGALLGIGPERTVDVIAQHGNSSAATIPIALAHAVGTGRIAPGQTVLLTAAGAGLVSGGAVLRW